MTDSLTYTPSWDYSDAELLISNVYSEQGFFGDGVTYGREMGRISPEGNIYGQTRTVREIISYWWWDGSDYQYFQVSGEAEFVSSLPSGPRPFGEIWRVRSTTSLSTDQRFYYDYYVWDSSTDQWVQVEWYFDVEKKNELPYPGYGIGAAHRVREQDVYVVWDGYTWKRFPSHSTIEDDEPERHLPPGFINLIVSDAELVFVSPKEIAVRQTIGGSGEVWVGSEKLLISETCSLFNHLPALDIGVETVTPIYPEPLTEYRIYLANNQSAAFSVAALPGDSTHNETPEWDFRGKLFLVRAYDESGNEINEPTGNLLSDYGVGSNALFVGRIETDNTPKASGGPLFRRVLDLSYISKSPSIRGLFYDVCDFYLSYIDQDTIRFAKFDGFRGQMYIPSQLVHIGEGYNVTTSSPWVSVDAQAELPEALNVGPLAPDTHYYIYIGNRIDELNFNAENERTGRPWQREDVDSEGNYDSALDLRLKPFFSTRRPEDFPYNNEPVGVYRMTDTYPLFYTRLLGHIYTDSNGKFLYAKDISYIRALTVNPTHLRGLADFSVKSAGTSVFRISAKPATAGVIYVGGHTIRAQDVSDLPTTSNVKQFNSAVPYLSNLAAANTYTETTLYVYLSNFDLVWGSDSGKLFFCLTPPTDGYLSTDWPGSGARWIATVKTDENGEFTAYWLIDSCGDTTEILLTQFEITDILQSQTSDLISQTSRIDYLFGWGSETESAVTSYVSDLWSGWLDLSDVTDDIWSGYSDLSNVTDSLDSTIDSLWAGLSDAGSYIDNLDSTTSAFGSTLSVFRSDLDSLDTDIWSLESTVSGMGDDISDLVQFQASFDSLTWSFLNNASDLLDLTESLESSVSEMYSDMSDMSELGSQLDDFESRLESDYSFISNVYSLMSQTTDYIIEDHQNLLNLHFWLEINESNLRDDYESLSGIQDAMSANLIHIFSNTSTLSDLSSGLFDVTSLIDLWVDGLELLHFNLEENVGSLGYYLSDLSEELVYLDSNLSNIDEQTDIEFSNVWSNMGVISEDVSYLFSYYSEISDYTDSLGESLSLLDSYTDSLSNLLVSLDSELWELDSNLVVQSGLIDSLESATEQLGSHLGVQSGYISALSDTAEDLDSHISAQSQYAQSLSEGLDNLDGDLALLDSGLDTLGSANISLASRYSGTSWLVGNISGRVVDMSQTADSYYSLTNSLDSILDNLVEDYSATSELVGSLDGDYDELTSRFAEISGYYLSYSMDINYLESTMSEVSEMVYDMESLTDELYSDASALSANVNSMDYYLSGMSGDISGLDSYISQLESNLDGRNTGYVGTVPQLITFDWIGRRFKFEDQKIAGLPIKLTYGTPNYIVIEPTQSGAQVVTPNGGLFDIRGWHILIVPPGLSPGVFYYVYLTTPNSLPTSERYWDTNWQWMPAQYILFSTQAPNMFYDKVRCLGDESILVGYAGVGSNGLLGGWWSVDSVYNPVITQSLDCWTTGLGSATTYLSGLIRPTSRASWTSQSFGTNISPHITVWCGCNKVVSGHCYNITAALGDNVYRGIEVSGEGYTHCGTSNSYNPVCGFYLINESYPVYDLPAYGGAKNGYVGIYQNLRHGGEWCYSCINGFTYIAYDPIQSSGYMRFTKTNPNESPMWYGL